MASRGYLISALILWFASSGWLLTTKILPTLTTGSPPDYDDLLPKRAITLQPVRWAIRWDGRNIGWAENRISRSRDGSGQIISEVKFDQLPVKELVADLLGVIGRLAGPMLNTELGPIDLRVQTRFDFDSYGTLSQVDTLVDVASMPEMLHIEGRVRDEVLDLSARIQTPNHGPQHVLQKTMRLPPNALVADTLSPRPRLANLRVGQKWTFQSYRPLMPHSPLELIEATVDREELLEWNGQLCKTMVVAYRRDAGSGLSTGRTPVSQVWVRRDGTVVRQDMSLANLHVQFIRLPSPASTAEQSVAVEKELAQK